jgi:hypothetical protein
MFRAFALKAADGTWGFRVHYVQNGQDTLVVRNVHQLKSQKQAMACADAHLILLANGSPGTVLGNPVEGLKVHQVDLRLFIDSRSGDHVVILSAYTPTNEEIMTYSSSIVCKSVEDIVTLLPRGIDLVAKALVGFGMDVPADWASPLLIGGTDETFVETLRKAVGSA